jgi:uncharacterized membrane protein
MAYLCVFGLAFILSSLALAQGSYQFNEIIIPDAVETSARGINNAGQIVGIYATVEDDAAGIEHGFLLDGDQLTLFDFPASFDTDANGINDNGDIIGTYANMDKLGGRGDDHGYLLSGGQYTSIDLPKGAAPDFNGINANGDLVGSYGDTVDGPNHGFLLSADGTFLTLDFEGTGRHNTEAWGINQDGIIVGTYIFTDSGGTDHDLGFVRSSDGTFTSILFPGAFGTDVLGINNNGDIVGAYTDDQGDHGFVKISGGDWVTVDFPGATSTKVSGINDAGQLVGTYTIGGQEIDHAFVASPP